MEKLPSLTMIVSKSCLGSNYACASFYKNLYNDFNPLHSTHIHNQWWISALHHQFTLWKKVPTVWYSSYKTETLTWKEMLLLNS